MPTPNTGIEGAGGAPMKGTDESNAPKTSVESSKVVLEVQSLRTLPHRHAFCDSVGYDGLCLLVFILINAGLLLYVVYQYTNKFTYWHRPWIWLFTTFAGLYMLLFAVCVARWRQMAIVFTKHLAKGLERKQLERRSTREKIEIMYSHWKMDGKYFLLKLYSLEVFESIVQSNNFISFFVCSLPVEVTIPMAFVLSIDAFHTAWVMSQKNRPKRRNRQVTIDTVMDFVFTTIPLLIIFFQYSVPISIYEMLNIVALPSICILAKVDDIFEEIVRYRSEAVYVTRTADPGKRSKARKHSLMRMNRRAKKQDRLVPRKFRIALVTIKSLFGLFFLALAIGHWGIYATVQCEGIAWSGCVVKVPFCNSVLHPTCNCAVLYIEKHNWTEVPSSIRAMGSLRKMTVKDGPLRRLFGRFVETYKQLTVLDLSHNHLDELPKGFSRMKYLTKLFVSSNQIVHLPDDIWDVRSLYVLDASNNMLSSLPSGIEHAASLGYLFISNNSLTSIPSEIGNTPLRYLALDGNNVRVIPENMGNMVALDVLRLNNNKDISKIPPQLGKLERLTLLDLRNNSLTTLPSELGDLQSLKYLFLEGNPLCNVSEWIRFVPPTIRDSVSAESGAGCKRQCSPYCVDYWVESYQICLPECNSEACKFQNGLCLE